MILDKIENYKLYAGITEKTCKGILSSDVNNDLLLLWLELMIQDKVFAIVQEYDTKEEKTAARQYIDIQYII
jgi:beta-galactosidase beta subunit